MICIEKKQEIWNECNGLINSIITQNCECILCHLSHYVQMFSKDTETIIYAMQYLRRLIESNPNTGKIRKIKFTKSELELKFEFDIFMTENDTSELIEWTKTVNVR